MVEWLQYEELTFFVYLAVIVTTLFKSRFTNVGIIQEKIIIQQEIGILIEDICRLIYENEVNKGTYTGSKYDFDFS